ncbi:MAG: carbohydrate ABC transporter permease [Anaerolineae bacterium]|nr:carbohydrate ABC transporter permease [Anaerolineae bacterium]
MFIFKPTLENYADLWLKSITDNLPVVGIVLGVIILALIIIGIFAKRLTFPTSITYWGIGVVLLLIVWALPNFVDTATFYDYLINTIIVVAGTLIISISIGCLSAYGLARYTGIAGVVILIAALAFRALPSMGLILPFFWIGRSLGLIDTYPLVILVLVARNQPFTIWMLRSFFMDIPREIEEAALIDGANRFTAFTKVIVPIMWPGIISTSLFTLLLAYQEFLMVRLLTNQNWTMAVGISPYAVGEDPGHLVTAAAAAVSTTLPLLLIIYLFQKQLVRGLTAGAVKG